MLKRKAQDLLSDSREEKVNLEHVSQKVLTVRDVCDLLQYVTLRHSHSVMKPSWFSSCGEDKVSRVNVMILDRLTQSHFYRYFTHFKHLRSKYSSRWTLAPSSEDLLSELLTSGITWSDVPSEKQRKLTASLMWHPVIRRFGLKTAGLSSFLLTEKEMMKHNFPVKGGRGCDGFVCTQSEGVVIDSSPLFGLDCEMCLTHVGLEVTRVSVVDSRGSCVLDELVKPPNPIVNYCTRFSGITRWMLTPVTTQLKDVQSRILKLLPPDAVLVGHSLENDLRALNLIHPHIIDTSLLYRKEFGQRFKLKLLAEVILKREIQSKERTGHDPCEDALAALHLAQYFISKGPRQVVEDHLEDLWELCGDDDCEVQSHGHHSRYSKDLPPPKNSSCSTVSLINYSSFRFGHALYRSGKSALFLSKTAHMSSSVSSQLCRRQYCSTDREVVCVFRRVVQSYSLSVLQFSYSGDLQQTPATIPQHLQKIAKQLREMCVLYVGPLPAETTEKQIHKLFRRCGSVQTVRFLHNTYGVHAEVVFEHLEGAALALEHLNGQQINDCQIKVRRPVHEFSLDLDERVSERHDDILNNRMIYVCNLSSKKHHHHELQLTFKQFGPIQHIIRPTKHAGKRSRHAFIKFKHSRSAQAAVGDALQIGNRKLLVCHILTPPHMTSWTQTHTVVPETNPVKAEVDERCDAQSPQEQPPQEQPPQEQPPQEQPPQEQPPQEQPPQEQPPQEHQMRKLDGKVGKVFRALERHCLSVVILPGLRSGAVHHLGLCFIHIKQDRI